MIAEMEEEEQKQMEEHRKEDDGKARVERKKEMFH